MGNPAATVLQAVEEHPRRAVLQHDRVRVTGDHDAARTRPAPGLVAQRGLALQDHDVGIGPGRARQHGTLDLAGDEVTGQRPAG